MMAVAPRIELNSCRLILQPENPSMHAMGISNFGDQQARGVTGRKCRVKLLAMV
jgi:hypothetical protein